MKIDYSGNNGKRGPTWESNSDLLLSRQVHTIYLCQLEGGCVSIHSQWGLTNWQSELQLAVDCVATFRESKRLRFDSQVGPRFLLLAGYALIHIFNISRLLLKSLLCCYSQVSSNNSCLIVGQCVFIYTSIYTLGMEHFELFYACK